MQGITEAIKYLYTQFILRDVVAYVAPGAILAACLLRVHFPDLEQTLRFIERIPKVAYVPIYGLLFTLGLGIQNFGVMIKLLKDNVRKDDEERFGKLQDFHRVVFSGPDQKNNYAETLERTRERIEVKKYASGNIALALVMGTIVILLAKFSWNAGRGAILATLAILAVSLVLTNRSQATNVKIWEDKAINHKPEAGSATSSLVVLGKLFR
jgi:hypothetical protein